MKIFFLSFIFMIICVSVRAQNSDSVYTKVDTEASFKTGDKKWKEHLISLIKPSTPLDRGAPAGTYTVVIQFIVNPDGSISDIKALTNHGYGMEDQVITAIKKSPKWKPALINDQPVRSYKKQIFNFEVSYEM